MIDRRLDVRLQSRLPERLPEGSLTALFVHGSCFHRDRDVLRVEIVAGGEAHPVMADHMPLYDLYRRLDDERSYLSGFWGIVPLEMPEEGEVDVVIRAALDDGRVSEAPVGAVSVGDCRVDPAIGGSNRQSPIRAARVAVAMATHEPDLELFEHQIESIRAQTLEDWICLISDDASSAAALEGIRSVLGDDERFVLSAASRRLGFYKNFERALAMIPVGADLVALADQDDRWSPDKLEALIDGLGDADLVYSDQRIVDREGALIAESYWGGERSRNDTNLTSLLISNTITGAASLFRRELLEAALPFPDPPGRQYHDHWLALNALAGNGIAYVDRALGEYVQHERAVLGHQAANSPPAGRRNRRSRGGRAAYFHGYCRLRVLAETLLLRQGETMSPGHRATLSSFAEAEDSPQAWSWLAARDARRLIGRTETLGAERVILRGLAWRRAIGAASRLPRVPVDRSALHAGLPGSEGAPAGGPAIGDPRTRRLGRRIAPLDLRLEPAAPERVNVLIPTVDLKHLFGGYIGKFNLARKLARHGFRTRILTVDPTPPLPWSWREDVRSYAGLENLFDAVELEFARDDAPVEIGPRDVFVATTWWTAHVAEAARRQTARSRFVYLIQEYEPLTFPMGSESALAAATYRFPHAALFSTAFLQEFFAAHGHGVYAAGQDAGRRDSVVFENAITPVTPPAAAELAGRNSRRLLFYARPEDHARRNMFELGLLGLGRAIEQGTIGPEWELRGIGSVDRSGTIALPGGRSIELERKRDQAAYAELLAGADVGLSLMATPHPSLVPIEMASAGMLTVTNEHETKTAAALAAISPNIVAVEASVEGVAAGLADAVARSGDHEARIAGAAVRWARDWDEAFDEQVLGRLADLIEAS